MKDLHMHCGGVLAMFHKHPHILKHIHAKFKHKVFGQGAHRRNIVDVARVNNTSSGGAIIPRRIIPLKYKL